MSTLSRALFQFGSVVADESDSCSPSQTMYLALPSELAHSAATYTSSRSGSQRPIFSPTTASYTEHLFYARRPSKHGSTISTMPRPNPPPTPGSSSDIRGKEGTQMGPTFNLPPTAFQEPDRASTSSTTPSANGSDSSYRPVSPGIVAEPPRKRPATQDGPVITKDDFALPPPPTRSRKIIQMKPQTSDNMEATGLSTSPQANRTQSSGQATGKRKQNGSGTTAAGRKIARKTAHSLIERRRRSKMNEEFGVLKDMIPACKGQEMHKLAILQVRLCDDWLNRRGANKPPGQYRIPPLPREMRHGSPNSEHIIPKTPRPTFYCPAKHPRRRR